MTGALTKFRPEETLAKDISYNAAIDYAQQIKDWPALKNAIDEKVEEQREFVAWWDRTVTPNRTPDRNNRTVISAPHAEEQTGINAMQVSRWRKKLGNVEEYKSRLFGISYTAAMGDFAGQLIQQSLSNEHYTPAKYIEAARAVLGSIELDPASCAEANEIVKADRFFDAEDDGLSKDWTGAVWLNPPYGRLAGDFILKLCHNFADGKISAAIALVNAHCTDTAWFQPLWNGLLCFTDHRINFYGDDSRSGSTHGSTLVYLGNRPSLFVEHFRQFGPIVGKITYG